MEIPHSDNFRSQNTFEDTSKKLVRNPLMRMSLDDPIICELPLDRALYEIDSHLIFTVLGEASLPATVAEMTQMISEKIEIDPCLIKTTIQDMESMRLLVPEDAYRELLPGLLHWENRGWLDALMLHIASRDVDYDDVGSSTVDQENSSLDISLPPDSDWLRHTSTCISLGCEEPFPLDQTFDEVLLRRRTGQPSPEQSLPLPVLSTLLRCSNKETISNRMQTAQGSLAQDTRALICSPYSALETWVFIFDVTGIPCGIYQYNPAKHKLHLYQEGLFRDHLIKMCIGQKAAGQGSAAFIISAIWERYMLRYRHNRAYRNLLINVSELAHKYILSATAFGLSNFLTPAFDDDVACNLLGVHPSKEAPLYMVAVG